VEALDLPVGLWTVGLGAQVLDLEGVEQLA
jgi:hypothetical protein